MVDRTERLVTIETRLGSAEANLARIALEEEDIRSFCADELTTEMAWHLSNAIGGTKLMVAERDAERACRILAEKQIFRPEMNGRSQPETDGSTAPFSLHTTLRRALRASVFGFAFLPLTVYALWQLIKISKSDEELSPAQHRKFMLAMAFCMLQLVFLFILFRIGAFLP
ncbi:DUF2007 domain-containing protein [Rubinisphaera sp. JC750]|uniref:putative signal transducing protein n=1 Tax=Rubinisphaera sp. JC750 TaxID=2898658 RepID=UPI001F169691|nr:DUF2007 domain-containing protein [Rubinisphaera sp. JC750]